MSWENFSTLVVPIIRWQEVARHTNSWCQKTGKPTKLPPWVFVHLKSYKMSSFIDFMKSKVTIYFNWVEGFDTHHQCVDFVFLFYQQIWGQQILRKISNKIWRAHPKNKCYFCQIQWVPFLKSESLGRQWKMEKVAEELTPGREAVNENILNKVKQLLIKFDKISLSWKVVSDLVVAIGRVGQASERFLFQIWNLKCNTSQTRGLGGKSWKTRKREVLGVGWNEWGMGWPCAKIRDRHRRASAQIRANMSIYPHHSGFPAFAWPSLERMQGKIKLDSIHSSNNILY